MPQVGTKLVASVKLCSLLTMALVLSSAMGAVPAQAQNLFGFFRAFAPPPAPAYDPFAYDRPAREWRRPKPRPKPAPVAQPEVKKPSEPRSPGDMDNPVPALLADSTLQRGDLVMFPDGLRVFTGRAGGQHSMADFRPLAQAGKHLSRATRKLVAHLLPSENPAWSMEALKAGGKLAANDDVATGSVKRANSRNGSRYR